MQLLHIPMIMNATTMLLIAVLLLFVRTMSSRDGLVWWIVGAVLQGASYLFAIVYFDGDSTSTGLIAFFTLSMCVTQFLCIGTLLFAEVPLKINGRLLLTTVSILGVISLALFDKLFLASVLFAFHNALYLFHAAFTVYGLNDSKISFKLVAIFMVLKAIHWLDFPLLSQVKWFVPIGFTIGMLLILGVFFNLVVCALRQFKIQTLDSEKRAIEEASIDSLTGLYNRSHLPTLFDNYVKEADQIERSFILLYFDLDKFKQINDLYGHKAGDLVLTTVSERMSNWLGVKGDAVRIGGDELIVLARLRGNYERKNAVIAAKHLLALIEEPIVDGDKHYKISASIGGCCYGLPLDNLEDMLSKSDKLMYSAKQAGGGRVYFSHSTLRSTLASSKIACKDELSVIKNTANNNSFY